LIAVDSRRLHSTDDLSLLLDVDRPATVTYARRRCLAEALLVPTQGVDRWSLELDSGASSQQLALRERWFRFL